MEGKSFMPGYFAMGKFSVDENSCYSRYENTVNGQIHNGFVLGPNNGYMGYDKEMLKRTMLEHEAIFRKQVSIFMLLAGTSTAICFCRIS